MDYGLMLVPAEKPAYVGATDSWRTASPTSVPRVSVEQTHKIIK